MLPRLAISLGDPNGIGPEVTLKALAEVRGEIEPVVVGSEAVLRWWAERLGLEEALDGVTVEDVGEDKKPEVGRVTAAGGALAMAAVARACDLCLEKRADGMVTAPIHKAAIRRAGYAFPGHTEFLAERTGAEGYVMLLASESLPRTRSGDAGGAPLRVGLVTAHVPVRAVPSAITEGAILAKLRTLDAALRRDFGVAAPRLAVLGLNPHAGDGGVIGTEDRDVIAPALERARAEGLDATGPHPADGFFGTAAYRRHDAVLAMYHDQGLAPFKALAMGRGVNVTAGLPIVRTSPDHGTGLDIAGAGRADPASMIAAVRMAARMARLRIED